MKNNILSAFVIFFAVLACLLIIDDIAHTNSSLKKQSHTNAELVDHNTNSNLATNDLVIDD